MDAPEPQRTRLRYQTSSTFILKSQNRPEGSSPPPPQPTSPTVPNPATRRVSAVQQPQRVAADDESRLPGRRLKASGPIQTMSGPNVVYGSSSSEQINININDKGRSRKCYRNEDRSPRRGRSRTRRPPRSQDTKDAEESVDNQHCRSALASGEEEDTEIDTLVFKRGNIVITREKKKLAPPSPPPPPPPPPVPSQPTGFAGFLGALFTALRTPPQPPPPPPPPQPIIIRLPSYPFPPPPLPAPPPVPVVGLSSSTSSSSSEGETQLQPQYEARPLDPKQLGSLCRQMDLGSMVQQEMSLRTVQRSLVEKRLERRVKRRLRMAMLADDAEEEDEDDL